MAFEEDYEEAAKILRRISIRKNFPATANIHPSWTAQLDSWEAHKEFYVRKEHDLKLELQKRHGINDERMETYLAAIAALEDMNLKNPMKDAEELPFKPFFGISASA